MSIIKTILLPMLYTVVVAIHAGGQALPDSIQVTYNKTSTLVFPSIIESVDRGSNDVIAQKAKGVSNVLHIKAGRLHFPGETNLTVITTNGKLYHFIVSYADRPSSLTYPDQTGSYIASIRFESILTPDQFDAYAKRFLEQSKPHRVKSIRKNQMRLTLNGIGSRDDALFFRLTIANRSTIGYDTEFFQLSIRDQKRAKRTATQEVPVDILYRQGDLTKLKGNSSTSIVIAVKKFTIPDAKKLVIQLMESNGGRHLQLEIKNRQIIRAMRIHD